MIDQIDFTPKKYVTGTDSNKKFRIPVEEHYEKDPESFKVPKEFTIHKGGLNYNALVKSFAVFTSDVEVPSKRFNKMTQSFKLIKTYEDVKKLDLPILNVHDDKDTNTKVIEIDLK